MESRKKVNGMTEKEWMKEGLDLKLTVLLYRRKVWISLLCALIGAGVAGGLYFLIHVMYAPAREYEAVSKLYLTFGADDDGDAYQYYNGYTWNDLMQTEPILDKIMESLSAELEREQVKEMITADILSDIRLLTVSVRSHSPQVTEAVIRAAEDALMRFGQEMTEFEKIEVIEHGKAALAVVEDETVRALLCGAVIGFLLSLFGLALFCILDDSVYVPSDFEKRYGYPVLGVTFAGDQTLGREALEAHVARVSTGREQILYAQTGEKKVCLPAGCEEDGSGLILHIPYGRGNGKLLERWIREAEFMDCEILGAVITQADPHLYRLYFATFGDRKKRTAP